MRLLLLLSIVACDKAVPPDQGIHGETRLWQGDFMPQVEAASGGSINPAKGYRVIALRGERPPVRKLERTDPSIAATAIVGADGRYRLAVPPGTYSMVLEDPRGGLFSCATLFEDAQTGLPSRWCTATVVEGEWTEFQFEDRRHATF